MRKMLVVAVREYLAAVRTKAFIIGLVVMPILMGGSIFMQWLLKDYRDVKTKKFAVVDRTPGAVLYGPIERIIEESNKNKQPRFELEQVPASADTPEAIGEQRIALSERVRKGEIFGYVDIGADVLKEMDPQDFGLAKTIDANPQSVSEEDKSRVARHTVRYQSNSPTNQDLPSRLRDRLRGVIEDKRFEKAQMQSLAPKVRGIMQPVEFKSTGLTRRNPAKENKIEEDSTQSRFAPIFVPIGFMMLMFMVIMMSATPLMQSVIEEKMQRIAEVLLGSVRPFDLMLGKLLGMTAVSMTISAVYLSGAYWAARYYDFADFIPLSLLVWFLIFQALAALMYGSLFIAVGAACTDMRETQNLMWPIMLLVVTPMFLMGSILQEPNSAISVGLSFFPFSTPMLMIMRYSVPPGVPGWQPIAGVLLVLATTLACVWAAGRIFRIGILMQGKGAKLGEIMRWVLHG